jgi:group I intron endonuclease
VYYLVMNNEKCGIYQIRCNASGKLYVGSSNRMYTRWSEHRRFLRKGKHHSQHMQHAWTKYGEDAFSFSIIEECSLEELETREQVYINKYEPAFNSVKDVRKRNGPALAALMRARAALITHCPRGHAYDEANTYFSKKGGKRICRACNAERVSSIYAAETPEQTEQRSQQRAEHYVANREVVRARASIYAAEHREEKKEYDKLHRAEQTKRKRERRQNETPEQREKRLAQKRVSHQRNRSQALLKMRERYRLKQTEA